MECEGYRFLERKQYLLFKDNLNFEKNIYIWSMSQNFIITKLSNVGLETISSQRWDDTTLNDRKCNSCTINDIGEEYHYLLTRDGKRVTGNCIWNRTFMLSQIFTCICSCLPQQMKQRSLNYQHLLQLLLKRFLCRLFFQMIETNFVLTYIKIQYICTVCTRGLRAKMISK